MRPRAKEGVENIEKFLKSAGAFVKPAVFLVAIALLILGYNALASSRVLNSSTSPSAMPVLLCEEDVSGRGGTR